MLFVTSANTNEWTEIACFAQKNEAFLRQYNGILSHDTLARVMGLISPEIIQSLYLKWNQLLSKDEGEKLKKVLNIDGKTIRGSDNKEQKALHVVSTWCHEDGMSLGEKVVEEKTNEIIAIPKLLQELCLKGKVVTIDAICLL